MTEVSRPPEYARTIFILYGGHKPPLQCTRRRFSRMVDVVKGVVPTAYLVKQVLGTSTSTLIAEGDLPDASDATTIAQGGSRPLGSMLIQTRSNAALIGTREVGNLEL